MLQSVKGRRLAGWMLAVGVIATGVPTVGGQETAEQVFVPSRVLRSEEADLEREGLYRDIRNDYDALALQLNLLKKVVKLVKPTVVHIESVKPEVNEQARAKSERSAIPTVEEAGSGVVIRIGKGKYILTNRHVVRDAKLTDVSIRLEHGKTMHPLRVWTDADTDVAVLEVADTTELVDAKVGDSDEVDIGDFVLAVGSPFGLSHSVSYGIVSAKGRRDLELGDDYVRLQDFLQTDTAINPGNSGGPLLNLKGEVIGVNTAIASNSGGNEGVSFAVPINLAMFVARQLIARGEVDHAYLGVQLDSNFDLAKARSLGIDRALGALVKGITPQSPAFYAKLQVNDVVVKYNDVDVEDDDHLVNLVSVTPLDRTARVEIIRERQRYVLEVKVSDRKKFEQH